MEVARRLIVDDLPRDVDQKMIRRKINGASPEHVYEGQRVWLGLIPRRKGEPKKSVGIGDVGDFCIEGCCTKRPLSVKVVMRMFKFDGELESIDIEKV